MKILYELIMNFNGYIFNEFKVEIFKTLTLPSLSQKIFINKYLKEKFVPFKSNMDTFLRDSYIGGCVDVYKPHGKNLIVLDINALYPYIMSNVKYSNSLPKYTRKIGNLKLFCNTFKAFIKVKMYCKPGLKHPLIAKKIKNKNIQANINCIHTIFSDELLYCLNYYNDYYTFIPISAYYYENNKYIFKDYINDLFKKRVNYIKKNDNSGSLLIKNMMNSFYGRFGIKILNNNTTKVLNKDLNKIVNELDYINNIIYNKDDAIINYVINDIENPNILFKKFKSRVD